MDGTRGKPTDCGRYTEADLVEKELDKGPEDFQLQYMLDTSLADAQRLQLKLQDLIVANFDWDMLPEVVVYRSDAQHAVQLPADFPIPLCKMFHPAAVQCGYSKPDFVYMFIDPAGGGADELGYAVGAAIGPYIHVFDCGGIKGGLTDENGLTIASIVREFGVNTVMCEKNMGHGLFAINLRAILNANGLDAVGISEEYSTGQKERRIIDSLVSSMQRHRVIIHKRVFESDAKYNKQHNQADRTQYSLFYQLANITTDRNSLPHDDRLEAFAGVVRRFKAALLEDEDAAARERVLSKLKAHLENPMGYTGNWNKNHKERKGVRASIDRRRRRK